MFIVLQWVKGRARHPAPCDGDASRVTASDAGRARSPAPRTRTPPRRRRLRRLRPRRRHRRRHHRRRHRRGSTCSTSTNDVRIRRRASGSTTDPHSDGKVHHHR